MQKLDSNIDDFFAEYCDTVADVATASTPAAIMRRMKDVDQELKNERELEQRLRARWHFVSPKNRHRIKLNRSAVEYIVLRGFSSCDDRA